MIRPDRPRHRGHRRRLRAALGLGTVLCIGVVGTQAAWTDSVAVVGATFSTGSIDLVVDDLDDNVPFTTINMTGMVPGSSTAGVLTVKNAGSVPLAYTAASAATNADGKGLRTALAVKVTGAASTSGSAPSRTCAGATLAGTGSTLVGSLVSSARTLAPGASETLCVQVTLPTTAASALQSATTTATLTFDATSDLP